MVIDYEKFSTRHDVIALKVHSKDMSYFVGKFRPILLRIKNFKNVIDVKDSDCKLILLDECIKEIPDEYKTVFEDQDKDLEILNHSIDIGYSNMSTDEVLHQIIPSDGFPEEIPSSFETVGHIAHLNLRSCYLPYKHLIGQVLLDKNKHIRTVVNKIGTISTQYRTFEMEVLAGEVDFNVVLKEQRCLFSFDFSKVYWNSRLQSEHLRLVDTYFSEGHRILDVMAGVGPFAIPAAKNKKCIVYANDLNPYCFQALKKNISLNKIKKDLIIPFNMDGREFLISQFQSTKNNNWNHVIMNLPACAVEFLDVLRNLITLPTLFEVIFHIYGFSNDILNPKKDMLAQIKTFLGPSLHIISPKIHFVRMVSPSKVNLCSSFKVSTNDPHDDVYHDDDSHDDNNNTRRNVKKRKIN